MLPPPGISRPNALSFRFVGIGRPNALSFELFAYSKVTEQPFDRRSARRRSVSYRRSREIGRVIVAGLRRFFAPAAYPRMFRK